MRKPYRFDSFLRPQEGSRCRKGVAMAMLVSMAMVLPIAAIAHYDPDEDSDETAPPRRRWDGWNVDWDRRWRRNWYPSWAPYDNDVVVQKRYVRPVQPVESGDPAVQINEWGSIENPGKEIPNFHQVHHFLFRGGQPTEHGLVTLYNMGVRTIVSLRCDPQQVESERQLCERNGLKLVNIPLKKTSAPSDQDICRFMDVVGNARESPDQGAVFVHDHLGADRTGAMVAIYRELADKYPFERAYNEMLQYGFHDMYPRLKLAVQAKDPNFSQIRSRHADGADLRKAGSHSTSTHAVKSKSTKSH